MRYRALILLTLLPAAVLAEELPDGDTLEEDAAIVGEILLDKSSVFDLSNPEENNWLYRLANRWHVVTKDKVIRKQLLFETGDVYSVRRIHESERILRRNRYLFDASIEPVRYKDGFVDVAVRTRDVWTLSPEGSATGFTAPAATVMRG